MIKRAIAAVFGTRHDRERRRIQPIVDEINRIYAELRNMSDDELRAQTSKFRESIDKRTQTLRDEVQELKQRKHTATSVAERDAIDLQLSGADGRGGAEGRLRAEIAATLEDILPEALAPCKFINWISKEATSSSPCELHKGATCPIS
jgi:preprotein translocase subunit SecA